MDLLRSTVAGALAGTAQVLSLTSRVLEVTADALRPSPGAKAPEPFDAPADKTAGSWPDGDPVDGVAVDEGVIVPVERELTDAELGLVADDSPFDDLDGAEPGPGFGASTDADPGVAAAEMTDAELGLVAEEPGTPEPPAATPLLDETPHLRSSDSHIEELGMQSASAVVAAVEDLSTDELRLLTEYETAHRNRKSVLKAIERALLPATG